MRIEVEAGSKGSLFTRLVAARIALPVYTATLFLSAGLLFVVEPMISKMALPRLGGSPNVWNTCLFFFQATLLLGYSYAPLLRDGSAREGRSGSTPALLAAVSIMVPVQNALDLPDTGIGLSVVMFFRLIGGAFGVF